MNLRQATPSDVPSIVSIHNSAFQGFFLTSLGSNFLGFYYSCFINNGETVVVVAEEEGKALGFSAASTQCKGFNSKLIKRNLLQFGMVALKMLFNSPKALLRLVKNLTKKGDKAEDDENYAELYSIGVADNQQGKGIGKCLLKETEQLLKAKGVEKVSLTTDYYDNAVTLGFYRSMGYETLYEFVTYPNRKMYRLIKIL